MRALVCLLTKSKPEETVRAVGEGVQASQPAHGNLRAEGSAYFGLYKVLLGLLLG